LDWEIDSAGTNGFHNGEHPHMLSQKVSLSNGVDISNQISRQLKIVDFEYFDKIYAMADDVIRDMRSIAGAGFDNNKVSLLLNESCPGTNKNVPDPWYGAEDGYIQVYNMIDEACEVIVSKYSNKNK
jgi:protein-tyrosine phosphatase